MPTLEGSKLIPEVNDLSKSLNDIYEGYEAFHSQGDENIVNDKFPRAVKFWEVFKYADKLDLFLIILGEIGSFGAGICMPAFTEVFGRMVRSLFQKPWEMVKDMNHMAFVLIIIGLICFVLCVLYTMCWRIAAARQIARIKASFLNAVMCQDVGWHDEHKPGELLSRMDGDTQVIRNGIDDKVGTGMMMLSTFIFGYGLSFYHSWRLALLMCGELPLFGILGVFLSRALTKMSARSREGFAHAGEFATEAFENIRTVQVYDRADFEADRFFSAIEGSRHTGIKKEFTVNIIIGLLTFIGWAYFGLAFWFSSYLLEWGFNDVADIVTTFFASMMGSFAIGLFFPTFGLLASAKGAARNVYYVIDRKPLIDINDCGRVPATKMFPSDVIRFEHIKFSYPTRKSDMLFTDLNFEIKRGTTVAFSGASGSGKSSIIQMVQRFYDPDEGAITVDGINLKDIDLKWWRDQIGVVSQEPNLFSGSITDNVRVGKADATMQEIETACRAANIHDLVLSLPQQYETQVGSVGSQMSGGQKQRLAIARAIVRKPQILILDEATSALDRKSEQEVQLALDNICSDNEHQMTVLVIAHRLTTIRHADMIYYIHHDNFTGSAVVESGSFDNMIALGGQFAAMVNTQHIFSAQEMMSPRNASVQMETLQMDGDLQIQDSLNESLCYEKPPLTLEEIAQLEIDIQPIPFIRLFKMNKGYYWAIFVGSFGSFLVGCILPVAPVVLSYMLQVLGENQHNPQKIREKTPFWAGMFLLVATASLFGWSFHGFYGVSGERMTSNLRLRLFSAMLRQDMTFFDTPGREAGGLTGILSGETEKIHLLCGADVGYLVQFIVAFVGGLIISFAYQWKAALVVAACSPITLSCGASQAFFGHSAVGIKRKRSNEIAESQNEDTCKGEVMSNVRTVIAFNLQGRKSAEYDRLVYDTVKTELRKAVFLAIMYGLMMFTFFGVASLGFWYGAPLVRDGESEFRDLMIASLSTIMGSVSAGRAMGVLADVDDTFYAAQVVFSIIDRKPSIDPTCTEGVCDIDEEVNINFKGASFRYPARSEMRILRNLSLEIPSGTGNGLIGQTGCGKSTIVQLLARFYDIAEGQVLINGRDIRSLNLKAWRSNLSIVMQEPALCSGSVSDNIRYSNPDATVEEVEEAAKLAHIHTDVLGWPLGYETDVGYKGRLLSGGQKQRVAIARALCRHSKCLLLDEATSALDNVTEGIVQQGIETACAKYGITSVAVAHRLTTIRNCDKIVLMDEGRIIEQGNHDELIKLNGEYKVRWDLYQKSLS